MRFYAIRRAIPRLIALINEVTAYRDFTATGASGRRMSLPFCQSWCRRKV